MNATAFMAAYTAWLHASAVLIAPNGFTYRVAESIGGEVRRYVGGRLRMEVR